MFEQWSDFNLVVGGAAAVLLGLIFVVVTLMRPAQIGGVRRTAIRESGDRLTRDVDNCRRDSYTIGMKTAVSIPDRVFEDAEQLAKRLNTSRSELYARALAQFVGEHAPDRVTDALNAAVDAAGTASNAFVQQASRRTFDRAEW